MALNDRLARRRLLATGLVGVSAIADTSSDALAGSNAKSRHGINPADHVRTINVRDFGASGLGDQDDSAAINRAVEAAREIHRHTSNEWYSGCRIVFPTGNYIINSTVDMTNLRSINTLIDGQGSVIIARCADAPAVDGLNSRWLTIRDLTVVGDAEKTPSVGMQIGIINKIVNADDHNFDGVKIVGNFSLAALYNRGSETSIFSHMFLWNNDVAGYCLVQDGLNHFGVQSKFCKVDLPRNTGLSFGNNIFISCDFRQGARGVPVWLGDTSGHEFVRCYSATAGECSFRVFFGPNGHSALDVDCHCESGRLDAIFLFDGLGSSVKVRGLTYKDRACFAVRSVFRLMEPVKKADVIGLNIDVPIFEHSSCKLVDAPQQWDISGTCVLGAVGVCNLSGSFQGLIFEAGQAHFYGKVIASSR